MLSSGVTGKRLVEEVTTEGIASKLILLKVVHVMPGLLPQKASKSSKA